MHDEQLPADLPGHDEQVAGGEGSHLDLLREAAEVPLGDGREQRHRAQCVAVHVEGEFAAEVHGQGRVPKHSCPPGLAEAGHEVVGLPDLFAQRSGDLRGLHLRLPLRQHLHAPARRGAHGRQRRRGVRKQARDEGDAGGVHAGEQDVLRRADAGLRRRAELHQVPALERVQQAAPRVPANQRRETHREGLEEGRPHGRALREHIATCQLDEHPETSVVVRRQMERSERERHPDVLNQVLQRPQQLENAEELRRFQVLDEFPAFPLGAEEEVPRHVGDEIDEEVREEVVLRDLRPVLHDVTVVHVRQVEVDGHVDEEENVQQPREHFVTTRRVPPIERDLKGSHCNGNDDRREQQLSPNLHEGAVWL
mmetsp:Transcript_89519/g.258230  ORF Transcript_89519/g.258230 Transcript_89519/m.258230 type:complete len:367 (-) Transcript_89519:724-1824(-)